MTKQKTLAIIPLTSGRTVSIIREKAGNLFVFGTTGGRELTPQEWTEFCTLRIKEAAERVHEIEFKGRRAAKGKTLSHQIISPT